MFITFEGVEGSGKTTQIRLLEQYLAEKRLPFVSTREPGGSPIGAELRKILLSEHHDICVRTELLLYMAERAEHVEKVIKPALAEGKWVLCDRFGDATRAYQVFGRGLPRRLVEDLESFAASDLEPDITVLLRLDPASALRRARARNQTLPFSEGKFEAEELDFHGRVYEGYEALAKEFPKRFSVIDASGEPHEVFARLLSALSRRGLF
ncbi:MAG TPA: dTMP kinase [Acidobacteriota bacterium]|nr:dTMP kinase [Acidobacteriota bacterium]HNT17693.1 dTMP kinase [Acidobacteriota bacterium]HPA27162.1 dTMP kinase [Acidobacteriota bacterium]HQO20163.1 dTMP kinase [Acidobacteriota bacterium]HQQ47165.1 dTMP kinase [Acidobacteriota bacterium]